MYTAIRSSCSPHHIFIYFNQENIVDFKKLQFLWKSQRISDTDSVKGFTSEWVGEGTVWGEQSDLKFCYLKIEYPSIPFSDTMWLGIVLIQVFFSEHVREDLVKKIILSKRLSK